MTFRLVKGFPTTFTPEDRECRGCWKPAKYVLVADGTDYSFASCDTPKCQEIVKKKLQKEIAKSTVTA